jgi:hypothetical protein
MIAVKCLHSAPNVNKPVAAEDEDVGFGKDDDEEEALPYQERLRL